MNRRARGVLFLVAAAGLAALLAWALAGLPAPAEELGRYAGIVANAAVDERHATNAVVITAFDYRALDTLGEEFLLFVAGVGTVALLRTQRGEAEERRARRWEEERGPATSDALRAFGSILVAPCLLVGAYVVSHGNLTPGGGFQGGVVLATALLLVYVTGRWVVMRHVRPHSLLEVGEAMGAGGFALVGLGGLIFAGAFFENFLPLGSEGDLLSGGTIPVGNLAVGLEVGGVFALILSELFDQMLLRRRASR